MTNKIRNCWHQQKATSSRINFDFQTDPLEALRAFAANSHDSEKHPKRVKAVHEVAINCKVDTNY
jgi:hypothetical protein